jgi:hypothetical protein
MPWEAIRAMSSRVTVFFDMIIALSYGMVASGVRQHSSRRGTVVVR